MLTVVFYWLARSFFRLCVLIWSRREVLGLENVPRHGPAILASNHLNLADPPLLATLVPRRLIFMAKLELWSTPLIGWLYGLGGCIPVRRFEGDVGALRRAEKVLRQGHVLVMYPEGTRSRHPGLGKGHPGTAVIALRSGVPIVPIGVSGTETVSLPGVFLRRTRVRIAFGQPFTFARGQRLTTELAEESTERIMKEIAALLPEAYRGTYAGVTTRTKQRAERVARPGE
ncbi:MAG TPA: lysophospholipid acyltransferase family protein [Dehalococcoidia bacterium]|nr:lysophospholipid acyltransferase family protein [Dehalococcoidia bacterium]